MLPLRYLPCHMPADAIILLRHYFDGVAADYATLLRCCCHVAYATYAFDVTLFFFFFRYACYTLMIFRAADAVR